MKFHQFSFLIIRLIWLINWSVFIPFFHACQEEFYDHRNSFVMTFLLPRSLAAGLDVLLIPPCNSFPWRRQCRNPFASLRETGKSAAISWARGEGSGQASRLKSYGIRLENTPFWGLYRCFFAVIRALFNNVGERKLFYTSHSGAKKCDIGFENTCSLDVIHWKSIF